MSSSPLELDPYVMPLVRGEEILDLGCGFGHWGHLLLTHYRAWRPANIRVRGVDLFPGNVDLCRKLGLYDEVILSEAVDFLTALPPKSVDTVIATELIEHMEKPQGIRLLAEVERVARKCAIFSTPNFPDLRGGAKTMVGFNEWEHHLSEWRPKEFRAHGYSVLGISHKLHRMNIRGTYRIFKWSPLLEGIARAFAERYPFIASGLLAAKNFDEEPIHFRYGIPY